MPKRIRPIPISPTTRRNVGSALRRQKSYRKSATRISRDDKKGAVVGGIGLGAMAYETRKGIRKGKVKKALKRAKSHPRRNVVRAVRKKR